MAVITISSQTGAGGNEIGRSVAQALGYDFADKNTVEGIFRQYGMTRFEDLYSTSPSFLDLFNHNNLLTIAMLNEIIEGLAQRDRVVIVGRGGFAVVGAWPTVCNVRLEAPAAVRSERLRARAELASVTEATALINENDDLRRKFVQMFYNRRWDDPQHFDLVLDTAALTSDDVVQRIASAAQALDETQHGSRPAVPPPDPVLADAINQVLAYPRPA
ncbi:MAG: cytidylate kinase-like family protein [Caldilineales bacterium]